MKGFIRKLLWVLHLDLTRNLRYDRLTYKVIKKVLKPESLCVDVGAHKGEVLEWMLKLAPRGSVSAFEPIPYLAGALKEKYPKRVNVFQIALSNRKGEAEFQVVKNDPAYSGFKKRTYKTDNPDIEVINVITNRLDSYFPGPDYPALIKIDVEGAEYEVLQGCEGIFRQSTPLVLFEFGLGAANHYGTKPENMYELLESFGLKIYTLRSYVFNSAALSLSDFCNHFNTNSEYYFVAENPNAKNKLNM